MINQKLNSLFAKLTLEELNCIENSSIDMKCEIDPLIESTICEKVNAKIVFMSN